MGRAQTVQAYSAVTAACLMVRKDIFYQVNGFNEEFEVAYNDVDFCLKVKKLGYRNVYTPKAELFHYESKSRGDDESSIEKSERFDREKALLLKYWENELKDDSCYNMNLTRAREDFSLNVE